jgi:hypothetical protein
MIERTKKLIREGDHLAEVEIELIYDDIGWSPTMSMEDAFKLERVQEALKAGELKAASREARLFQLRPVSN